MRPVSSAITPFASMPVASMWPWSRYVVITESVSLAIDCRPTTTASWPMYRWQKPAIRPMP